MSTETTIWHEADCQFMAGTCTCGAVARAYAEANQSVSFDSGKDAPGQKLTDQLVPGRYRARYLWLRADYNNAVDAMAEWIEDGDCKPEALDAIIDRLMEYRCRVCGAPCPSAQYRCQAWDCSEVKPRKPNSVHAGSKES